MPERGETDSATATDGLALIDTGASHACIDQTAANRTKLIIVAQARQAISITGQDGLKWFNMNTLQCSLLNSLGQSRYPTQFTVDIDRLLAQSTWQDLTNCRNTGVSRIRLWQ